MSDTLSTCVIAFASERQGLYSLLLGGRSHGDELSRYLVPCLVQKHVHSFGEFKKTFLFNGVAGDLFEQDHTTFFIF